MGRSSSLPLFETKSSRRRLLFKFYLASVLVAICLIWAYRISYLPEGLLQRWAWIGLFIAEVWFTFYWIVTQVLRWNLTFRDRLSQRYEKHLPGIDIFVCTADPVLEPPIMVFNTVLSVMAYDYPPEKLNIYLSDDGGSDLTFYAMLEASKFSKYWLPFCKKFNVEPRSPEAYFRSAVEPDNKVKEWLFIKEVYLDMKNRIESTSKLGKVSDEIRKEHKGFRDWDFVSSRRDHQTILEILINGRDPKFVDSEGQTLPTFVYLAREKRPQYPHHFKAGAMNSLIRVSSSVSNSPIILNVDCDMYSNNANSIRNALCFFMDDEKGHEIGYVQSPQAFENITKNDLYGNSLHVSAEVEIAGLDANGGPPYFGTGCFHRREALCGKQYIKGYKVDLKKVDEKTVEVNSKKLEEVSKVLASCSYENDTEWGKEMGLKYGYATEDVMTGLCIQCRGWRSINYNPERKAFLGVAPTTLLQSLVQHKRWAEGNLHIFLSKYCPFLHGLRKIPFKLQVSYCTYLLWAANSLATLYYVSVPSICLLRGISLFPQASNPWFQPFAYAMLSNRIYGLGEFVWCDGTFHGWWNDQRIWLFKRTSSYFFASADNVLRLLGFTKSAFAITAKVVDEDVSKRYEQEVMEFGSQSPVFNIIVTLALFNMFCFLGVMKRIVFSQTKILDEFAVQIILCGLLVIINMPVYEALFFRKDKGRMPTSVTCKSVVFALLVYSIAVC
ncbi:hypothetical protein K2173_018061 [Erythroxylum novogranatense]|uniref:Cellulose synthase-like protein E1 n=1 Tax=Erythroxylum novogranatense TaxID=1862640 RepID=A0AAV8TWM2_9ROSI|nr:hypothetical protein K2173_018061 [Erythroxylum novogranatense]